MGWLFLRVVPCVSFFSSVASLITYLFALRFPYGESVECAFVFVFSLSFFLQHTCHTLCSCLLSSPTCLWVGRGWGFIQCFYLILSPSSCTLRPCVRLCMRARSVPLARSLAFLTYLFAIPFFPRGSWASPIPRACACLRLGRGGVSYHVSPCSCLRLHVPCGLVYVCVCVRGPSLWRPPSHP